MTVNLSLGTFKSKVQTSESTVSLALTGKPDLRGESRVHIELVGKNHGLRCPSKGVGLGATAPSPTERAEGGSTGTDWWGVSKQTCVEEATLVSTKKKWLK